MSVDTLVADGLSAVAAMMTARWLRLSGRR
jgi:hypothetical protein